MKKDGHFLAVSILVVLVLIMAEICYYVYTDNKEEPVYNISIIVYGNDQYAYCQKMSIFFHCPVPPPLYSS